MSTLEPRSEGADRSGKGAGGRVLVVDDEPAVGGLMRDVLARFGHEVVVAAGGEEALAAVQEGAFDLVVSDYAIPGMNGLEFARRLGAERPGLRVLVVSAFLDPETEEALLAEPNVAGLLRKPFDILSFARRVAGLLRSDDLDRAGSVAR